MMLRTFVQPHELHTHNGLIIQIVEVVIRIKDSGYPSHADCEALANRITGELGTCSGKHQPDIKFFCDWLKSLHTVQPTPEELNEITRRANTLDDCTTPLVWY